VDNSRARVTGPFTVEAVPAPMVKPLGELVTSPSPPVGEGWGEGEIASPSARNDQPTQYQVEVLVFDYYNTKTGNIESGGTDRIAMWMLDTDYDGRSLFPRQVFFPMAGEKDGWSRLAKNLKAVIDEELIEAYRGTVSLPFEIGDNRRIAVKIIDDRGIESLKIIEVE
jgi:adenine-specific DNA-methyltransferase